MEQEQRQVRKRQLALRTECQPPTLDSDTDVDTDEDIYDDDVELNE